MAIIKVILGTSLLLGFANGQALSAPMPSGTESQRATTTSAVTLVSDCHNHGNTQFCFAGLNEYQVLATTTGSEPLPSAYSACHDHDSELYCLKEDGGEVQLLSKGPSIEKSHTITEEATPSSTTTAATAAITITAVTSCHNDGATRYCMDGLDEYQVLVTATGTQELPSQYTGCHGHDADELYCHTPDGGEVQLLPKLTTAVHEQHDEHEEHEEHEEEASPASDLTCHFHAGVEHCTGASDEANEVVSCERRDRDNNIPLRIGLVFAILAACAIGKFQDDLLKNIVPNFEI
jgi:zinc transporter 1/2/3